MRTLTTRFQYLVLGIVALSMVGILPASAATIFVVKGTVQKADGSPVSGLTVTVENTSRPNLAVAESPEPTDASGQYSVTFISPDFVSDVAAAGDELIVTAREGNAIKGQTTHVVTAGEESDFEATVGVTLSGVQVQFDKSSVAGDGADTATITVQVTDKTGAPVTNDTLTATATRGSVGPFQNGGDGSYTATFTAPVSSLNARAIVTVSSSVVQDATGQAEIAIVGVPSTVVVAFADAVLPADGAATTTVTATIARNDIPVTDATVTFVATTGAVGDVTNNGDGTYTATYTAGTVAGTATVTATAAESGDKGVATISLLPGPPAEIASVVAAPATIPANGNAQATFTAQVNDENGNGVPGVEGVTAAIVEGDGSLGDVQDAGDGAYTVVYTSPVSQVASTVTVRFTAGDLTADGTLELSAQPEAETIILTVEGTVFMQGGGVAAPNDLTVTVTNVTQTRTDSGRTGDAGDGRYTVTFADFTTGNPVASSGDLIRVVVTDADGVERGRTERFLSAEEVEGNSAVVDVETDLVVTSNVLAITGTVTYDDGETPVSAAEGLTADVSIGSSTVTETVGNAGPGRFSAALFNAETTFKAGDLVFVKVRQDGDIVAEVSFEATPAQVFDGAIDLGDIQTTVRATSPAFGVTGSVTKQDGSPVADGTAVRVSNLSRPQVSAQSGTVGDAGPGAYSVAFFALGQPVIGAGDVLLIEVLDETNNVIGSADFVATTPDVVRGDATVDVALTGVVISVQVDSTTLALGADGSASATITASAVDGSGQPTGIPITFEPAAFFSEPVELSDGQFQSTFTTVYSRDGVLGPLPVTISAGTQVRRRLSFNIVDDAAPEVSLSPANPSAIVGHTITIKAEATDNTAIESYAWDLDDDGVVDSTGPSITQTYRDQGEFPLTLTVRDIAGNQQTVRVTVPVTTVTVGGLAIDLPNYIRLVQKTLSTALDAPGLDEDTRALVKSLLPRLIRNGSLLGVAVPIFPPTLDTEPTKPVLVPDPSGLDLENFGNPLFAQILEAAGEDPTGLLNDTLRVPLAVVGNKFNLYVRSPGASQVTINLISDSGAKTSVEAIDVSATGSFDYPFVIDEELLLLILPAWPGSETNPLASVTLRLADDKNGPYQSIPLSQATLTVGSQQKRVWRTTETLDAGTTYYYYYELEFAYPVTVGANGQTTTTWAVPDVRNLQFEDRGFPEATDPELQRPLLDTVALKIQPIVGSLLGEIQAEATRLAEQAILNDPDLQRQIANDPDVQRIIQNRIQTDPRIQNKILANATVKRTIERKLARDAALQQQLLQDPQIKAALLDQPAVIQKQNEIGQQVATELGDDPRVEAAFQQAFEAAVLSGKTVDQARDAGQAAAEAKIRELATPLVEQRVQAALPGLLAQVAPALLPIIGPKIIPDLAPELGPIVAPIILPDIQADVQPILIQKFGPQFLNQALANVVGKPEDLVARAEAELLPFADKVGARIATTGDVPIVSKFSVPAKEGLWIASADMESIPDGDYMVQVEVDGGKLFANAKPIRIDRSPGDVGDVEIAANPGAGLYVRESDGVAVAAPVDQTGTLKLSASVNGDGFGALFQMLGVEDDPAQQVQRVWIPVNQSAIVIATALRKMASTTPADELYDTALLAVVASDPDLVQKLQALDPQGIATFVDGFNALPPAKQQEIRRAARIVRNAVLGGNTAAAGAALSLNFAALGDYAQLVSELPIVPGFAGQQGSITMLFPPIGRYYLRAVSVDQFGNLNTQSVPKRIDIVAPEADIFRITSLSIGDQNGNGSADDPFESIEVGEDGQVSADDFRIWANTASLDTTIENVTRTAHPLLSATLQLSTDGATWQDIASLTAEQLAAVGEGDSFTLTYAVDASQWIADGVTSVELRVVAENALTVTGESPTTTLTVDENPLAIEPEVLALTVEEAEGSTPSPDSGGFRGNLTISAQSAAFTAPPVASVRIEFSADNGATYSAIDANAGGPADGLVTESTPVEGARNAVLWTAEWDTTAVADTVENKDPESRDATQDDNPYKVRVVLLGEDGSALASSDPEDVAVDNVDDVPPISGTVVTNVEREAFEPGTFEAATQDDQGVWLLRAQARFTVTVAAPAPTIENGQVVLASVDEAGAVTATIGTLDVVSGQSEYTFTVNTNDFENGVYRLAALAQDESGNRELVDLSNTIVVDVENIRIAGLRPDDPNILVQFRIVHTGDFDTTRNLGQEPAQRPVSGQVVFEVDAPGASVAGIFASADPADLADEVLQTQPVDVTPDANGTFTLPLDVSAFADGTIYVRFAFGASPNVLVPADPVPLVVDNTAPDLRVVAPAAGAIIGTRPILWAEYEDASGVVLASMSVSDAEQNELFNFAVGSQDTVIQEESPDPAVKFTGQGVVYRTPNAQRFASGPYVTQVSASDLAGNRSEARSNFTVRQDTQAPTIVSYRPTGVTRKLRPEVAATFTDDTAGVARSGVSIRVTGPTGANVSGSTVLRDANGAQASSSATLLSGSVVFTPSSDLAAGEYSATAVVTDTDGNRSLASWNFTVERDEEAPTVVSVSPTGTVNTTDVTLVVAFTDDSTVKGTFSVDGGAAKSATIQDGTRARLAVTGLKQGLHSVVATLTDEHGNKATTEYAFTVEIDIVPPAIAALTPTGYIGSARPTITATYSDNLAGVDASTVVLKLDGKSASGADADETHVVYTPKSDLKPGEHTVLVQVADALANEATAEWTFTIETTPPSISTVVPSPGAKVRGGEDIRSEIVVTAFYSDAQSGVDESSVSVKVTSEGRPVAGTLIAKTATAASWKAGTTLAAGVYDVTLSVSDNVGNKTEHEWSFIVEDEVALTGQPPRIVPNPFADQVSVWIGLGREAEVSIRIYDFNQRLVASRPSEVMMPGTQKISLDQELATFGRGVYFAQIIIDPADQPRVVKILKMAKVR